MFTGLVQTVGTVVETSPRLTIEGGALLDGVAVGDSIAVAGACLTVVSLGAGRFTADVSAATREATTLGALPRGARVNLEKALTLATPLGGHLVSGHVDGVAEVRALDADGSLRIRVPDALARYIARKGSVCIDGVSLTVNGVTGAEFEVTLVAHTLAHTTLAGLEAGDRVNLEVDMMARYLERLREYD